MKPARATALFASLLALGGLARPVRAQGRPPSDPVAVSSSASLEYEQQKFGPGAPKPESYLFFQGKFYGGTTRDPNLEKAQFGEIVKVLGESMARQNYFPSKDPKHADLLVVVHWGVSTIYENPNKDGELDELNDATGEYNREVAEYQSGSPITNDDGTQLPFPDASRLNGDLAQRDADRALTMRQIALNAQLLGFDGQLLKDHANGSASSIGVSTEENTLLQSLAEERYFIILMAYDFRTMKKGTAPKLLWSTRFSIRAPGNFFTAALPVMSKVAADYFGHALDGLRVEVPGVREGHVKLGAPTVIDSPSEGTGTKKK